MVSGLQGATYKAKLKDLGLLSLEDRRTKYDLVQTFKIIRGFDDVKSETWVSLVGENPARLTRPLTAQMTQKTQKMTQMMQNDARLTRHSNDTLNINTRHPRCEIRKKVT